ncbi:MAG TPA: AAA family ATPase [Anaerolineales bacterium]|nr:AAA family ATPase [Anaerolineales bacterium]
MFPFPYKRLVVIGTTGSGKSMLAEQIAGQLNLNYIELDAFHWEPGWQEAPLEVFRERVSKAVQAPAWIAAGNYHVVRDLVWQKAEAVIWLDYPFWTIFKQLTRRTFKRWWTQELLWGTNHERLWDLFKLWSNDSLYLWLFKTYWRRKRETPALLAMPEHRHLKSIRLHHPREAEAWLERLNGLPAG